MSDVTMKHLLLEEMDKWDDLGLPPRECEVLKHWRTIIETYPCEDEPCPSLVESVESGQPLSSQLGY